MTTQVALSQITYGKITYERKTNLYKKFKNNGDVKEWLKEEDKNKVDVFELYFNESDGNPLEVWNKLMESGADLGIKPAGLGSRDTLRLEMGFALYGNDISDETSPIAAGLGWVTKFNKDFIGKEIQIHWTGIITCRKCMKTTKKSFIYFKWSNYYI